MTEAQEVHPEHPMDSLIQKLQRLRAAAGSPSYGEIAQRVSRRRREGGASEAAARVSKTTIYAVFQQGRRRLNVELVEEVLLALEVDDAIIRSWKESYAEAQLPPTRGSATEDAQDSDASLTAPPDVVAPAYVVPVLLLACISLNVFGNWLVLVTRLPLFLDMIGTATTSVLLGPLWGALVGVATNAGEVLYDGTAALPFALVQVVAALIWGYGARRFGMGRTLLRFLLLTAGVSLGCAVCATPILLTEFGGVTNNADSAQALSLSAEYHSLIAGVFSSDFLTSLADKAIASFGAIVAAGTLPVVFIARLPASWGAGMGSARATGHMAAVVRRYLLRPPLFLR